ncbi:hypothetical protein K7X08_014704 [Anisodus acutangulus]|uniref:Amino acid transporter transmembrane domain-containing protein n=1 Tax=Anisodus acutangulus TaxID=402998 RepID=A0A9Q1R1H1_9SOLA|nr:hypothetical protein K7X08_014704 [Anisodus acutangulus]
MPKTPKSPLASPMKKALAYMEEIGQLTKLHDHQDAWLPITESRSGNAYYAAFHTLSSGTGVQALLLPLPLAFITLGCRYLRLSMAAFGGTCVTLIMIGGSTMKIFFQTWYIVFTVSAIVLAQLPNLNSIAGISLISSLSAVTYYVPFELVEYKSDVARICSILNTIGMIAFAFRGHNLVLEIQGTMPSNLKNPSHVPMWKEVKFSYSISIIALCLFPLSIGGYWACGNLMPNGGILSALDKYHGEGTSKVILGITSLLVVVHCLTSFRIYARPVFDNLEFRYTNKKKKSCPWWSRTGLRIFFGCLAFFISVALPFFAKFGWAHWRHFSASNLGISLSNVDNDQETKDIYSKLVC